MSDILYQCQSVAAGFVASADAVSVRRDVEVLVAAYHRVRPDAPFVVRGASGIEVRTTLRRQIALAAANLQNGGCAPAQARRLAAAAGAG